jgi:hypothetical protein
MLSSLFDTFNIFAPLKENNSNNNSNNNPNPAEPQIETSTEYTPKMRELLMALEEIKSLEGEGSKGIPTSLSTRNIVGYMDFDYKDAARSRRTAMNRNNRNWFSS